MSVKRTAHVAAPCAKLLVTALTLLGLAAPAHSQTADSFNPGADNSVFSMAVQPDGKILVGGAFTALGGQSRNYLGRLNAEGTLDNTFNPGANSWVNSLALQADGKILLGGGFTTLGGQTRNYLARLNADGTLDSTFNPGAEPGLATVYSLAVQADGKILVGGTFPAPGGQTHNYLRRLNADGTLDSAFDPRPNSDVLSLAMQADGKILVAGRFTALGGQTRNYLARLNADGTLDSTFNPGANNDVYSLAVQADGKILLGGNFATLGGQTRNYLGRLNADGTLDNTLNPGANSSVLSLAVQADGKILAGGDFTTLGGQTCNYFGRLNADGTLDSTFNPGANSSVISLAVQVDGKILAGGQFTRLSGQTRKCVGRLNNTAPATQSLGYDGSTITWLRGGASPEVWRTTFEHSADGLTWTNLGAGTPIPGGWQLAGASPPAGGTLRARGYVTGATWFVEAYLGALVFITQPTSQTNDAGTTATLSVLLGGTGPFGYQWFKDGVALADGANIAGALTSTLTVSNVLRGDAESYHVVVTNAQGSGTSVVALLTVRDPAITSQLVSQLKKAGENVALGVVAAGTPPLSYQWRKDSAPLAGATASSLSLTNLQGADAGNYDVVVSNVFGSVTSMVVELSVNLAVPDSYNPDAGGHNPGVSSLAVQPDGKVLVAGWFTTLGGANRGNIGRLNADGTLDSTFNPGAYSPVYSLAVQADGKVLVGGFFGTLGGQTCYHLGRLNPDGTLDGTFNPGADNGVYSLAVQADGKILVGGYFTTLGGQARLSLGRLNADGTLDSAFNPGAGGGYAHVYSLAVQADGKVLVAGAFDTLGWGSRTNIGRLNADGTLDTTFNPGAYLAVYSLAVQADGKVLVGGAFTTLGGQPRNCLGRLNADGTLDNTFNPGANKDVYSLAIQADGKILVGGNFTTLGGGSRTNIGRLNPDGALDSTFNPGAGGGSYPSVYSLAVQADGKVLVGGSFTILGGQPRNGLGRLTNTPPATQSLGYDGSTITWLRGGTSPEVWRTTFDYSEDGLTWTNLGAGTRIPGGWQLAGVAPPTGGTLRGRGYVTGGEYNASSWFVEASIGLVSPAQRFASIVLDSDGALRASVVGPPGRSFTLQGTPDLSKWTDLGLYTNQSGTLVLTIVPPAGQNTYFYRTHSP